MEKIRIFLTNKGFEKCYLHYLIETNEYYLFVNTKKYNRKLKEIIGKAKEQIHRENIIEKSKRLKFIPLGYEKTIRYYDNN